MCRAFYLILGHDIKRGSQPNSHSDSDTNDLCMSRTLTAQARSSFTHSLGRISASVKKKNKKNKQKKSLEAKAVAYFVVGTYRTL